jgi:hypothetical protein
MDVVIIGPILSVSLFLLFLVIWFSYARSEQKEAVRLKKKAGVFLIWFLINWLYIMSQLLSPVWYEPSEVNPGLNALYGYLPLFVIFSIPFVADMINQWRLGQI